MASSLSAYERVETRRESPNQHTFPVSARKSADGHLAVGGCRVADLADVHGTPLMITCEESFRTSCQQFAQTLRTEYPGDSLALYASKAWPSVNLMRVAAAEGMGMDVSSVGELLAARWAGVDMSRVYVHGNNKPRGELLECVRAGSVVVVDSMDELEALHALCEELHAQARVMIRITPGIEIHTHEYIRTGQEESKFGVSSERVGAVFAFLAAHPSTLCAVGLHAHIGSQAFALEPYCDLVHVLHTLFVQANTQHGLALTDINVGGGLGVAYTAADAPPSIVAWCTAIAHKLRDVCAAPEHAGAPLPRLVCEAGRSVVATSTVTAYRVGSVKRKGAKTFVSVDGGMSDNPRVALYGSVYTPVLANRMHDAASSDVQTVVGCHCESGDVLVHEAATLPAARVGDVVVLATTGAYHYSMSSNYNMSTRPAVVGVEGGKTRVLFQRETLPALLRLENC